MRAIEFKSRIKNNKIQIPKGIEPALKEDLNKDIRVIVLFDDSDNHDIKLFQQTARVQFLRGYDDSDSIYDNY